MRIRVKLDEEIKKFIISEECNCKLCQTFRKMLQNGYDITLQLVR